MIDHLSLGVSDLARAIAFYDAVLRPLGYRRLWTTERGAGYGARGTDEALALFAAAGAVAPGPGWHLALTAPSREAVDAFHAAARAAGAADECRARGSWRPGRRLQSSRTNVTFIITR